MEKCCNYQLQAIKNPTNKTKVFKKENVITIWLNKIKETLETKRMKTTIHKKETKRK